MPCSKPELPGCVPLRKPIYIRFLAPGQEFFSVYPRPTRAPMPKPQPKPRRYCWMVGCAFEMGPTDNCPECNQPATTHREVEPGTCGDFTNCPDGRMRNFSNTATDPELEQALGKPHDGHPCTLPPDHPGPHESAASKHCTIVTQAIRNPKDHNAVID